MFSYERGAFGRGFPQNRGRSAHPGVATSLRTFLRYCAIERDEDDGNEAVRKCHRQGWISAERTAIEGRVRYMLPSPRHAVYLSWKPEPTNDVTRFTCLLKL
jgi:hypothetical protein